jgi:hypothetical protein
MGNVTALRPLPRENERETGPEELRRIVACLDSCCESMIERFSVEELVQLQRAAWACEWDVFVDNMSEGQCRAVLELGEVPAFYDGPRGLVPIPSGLADNGEVFDFIHPHLPPFGDQSIPQRDEARAIALADAIAKRRERRERI